ncbi:hypothetical protein [uncultured Parabacteroides sp.]|uniref:hypothetical protein n=1 Tax=uncultured Parabacteroides sp. TaxID=512312 RepID=UPI0025DCBE2F|nr:hypothetical protein [uncultured Parabacteroides sp.]
MLLRSLRSLWRLKLASLKQQTLRTLTAVTALNAHQLRPEVEPDGSVEDGATAGFAVLSTTLGTGTGLSPCPARRRKEPPVL